MKILIAGAPKTGNMWLKNILGHLYQIPIVDISGAKDFRSYLDNNHPKFVTHQHFMPKPYILAWGKAAQAHFITMARHPGDLFVSLYFYVNHYAETWRASGTLGHTPSHQMIGKAIGSSEVMAYLENDFHGECLGKTLAWVRAGVAYDLRYEDLKQTPQDTIAQLAVRLGSVSSVDLKEAIKQSSFKNMRRQAGSGMKQHFRKGKSGSWRQNLNSEHCEILEKVSADAMNQWNYEFSEEKKARNFFSKWWA